MSGTSSAIIDHRRNNIHTSNSRVDCQIHALRHHRPDIQILASSTANCHPPSVICHHLHLVAIQFVAILAHFDTEFITMCLPLPATHYLFRLHPCHSQSIPATSLPLTLPDTSSAICQLSPVIKHHPPPLPFRHHPIGCHLSAWQPF